MNSRAQLSIEMLFTVLFLFTTVNILFAVSGSFTENQAAIHLQNQETKIANSLSKILVASKSFEGADSRSIEYTIPEIYILGKVAPMPCDISIVTIAGNQFLKVSAEYNGQAIYKTIPYNGPPLPGSPKCGGKITIS
ncbi:MAG: hypothetical protein V1493_04170 [Candidatus Diapherotrites archaeon]